MSYALAPLLSEKDEAESAEGGIDPPGLYTIADALGVKLVPGVRERQSHPRFLTCMAVSLAVCGEFEEDTLARDAVSEPWLVFELYLVEGLVRTSEGTETIGLPGSLKAKRAVDDRVPLSAKRYLKTPSVFGFHGIYRLLTRTLGVQSGDRLGELGYELLTIWAKEQGLDGFVGTAPGPGQAMRRQWVDAVKDGWENAATARSGAWAGWNFFREHLGIYNAGRRERQQIASMLLNDASGFRRDVIELLVSPGGRDVWEATKSERRFHEILRRGARDELRLLLDAIASYETFSRLCQDSFDDCLLEMTRQRGKTPPAQLGRLTSVELASRQVPEIFGEVLEKLDPFGEAARFRDIFGSLAERGDATSWAERLAEHHRKTQQLKPPDGKNPWFGRFDGNYIIRPLYCRDEGGQHDDSYVHAYRAGPLWSFAKDLKLV
ncbi:MAG: hypothetical protein HY000_05635 [Planctomycetes bacterium]|nr:hypothetical protein [Planctomycetota bacterium]